MTDTVPTVPVFIVNESASGSDFIPVVETQEDNPAGSRSRNRLPILAKAKLIAVLIDSPIVGLVWFALDDGFQCEDEDPSFLCPRTAASERQDARTVAGNPQSKIGLRAVIEREAMTKIQTKFAK